MKIIANKPNAEYVRLKNGFNYTDLADRVGITRQGLRLIFKGETGAAPQTAKKICEVLNCDFEEIFLVRN